MARRLLSSQATQDYGKAKSLTMLLEFMRNLGLGISNSDFKSLYLILLSLFLHLNVLRVGICYNIIYIEEAE